MTAPKPRRRLLICVVYGLFAVALTFFGMALRFDYRTWQASEAASVLRQLGAHVTEGYDIDDRWVTFARAVGLSTTSRVFERTHCTVRIDGSPTAVEAVRATARRPDLIALEVRNAPDVGDDAIASLRDCTRVGWLTLHKTGVTDSGLRYLKNWNRLRWVSIEECAVSDEGIRFLCGLPSVELVRCSGAGLREVTVRHVSFAGPAAAAPEAGRPLTISGRLCLKTPLPAATPVVLHISVGNDESGTVQHGEPALLTPDGENQAVFSVITGYDRSVLQSGRNTVYFDVRILRKPVVLYRLEPIRLTVQPAAP
jgi:hypothetical protein